MGHGARKKEAQSGLQGEGGPGCGEGPGDVGPVGRSGQIQAWKKVLAEGAAGVFGKDREKKSKNDAALIPRLYQEIGQLKVERDFLADRSGP